MIASDDRVPFLTIWLLIVLSAVQLLVWLFEHGVPNRTTAVALLPQALAWLTLLLLAALVTHRGSTMQSRLTAQQGDHDAVQQELGGLKLQNDVLRTIGQAIDVPAAFQALAPSIDRFVPCDRIGLALLDESGHEFQTYTARTQDSHHRPHPRPQMVFRMEGTALGQVVRSRAPLLIPDTREASSAYIDTIVLAGSGLSSALLVPLLARGQAVGTLNLVSRRVEAFTIAQADQVAWIAEILAVAWMAQTLHRAEGREQAYSALGARTVPLAAEINSALQTIIGYCDLIRREYGDQRLQRDIDTVTRQAERIADLLQRMRAAVETRLPEAESAKLERTP